MMVTVTAAARIRVGTLEELKARGVIVAHAAGQPIAVFAAQGKVYAVDNRCPHMGFPLHQGTVKDCVLTCHWHQARFDLASGCTFDLFADDVPAYDTFVEGGEVFVASSPRELPNADWHRRRLREGMEQNIGLIVAKGLIGLLGSGADPKALIADAAGFLASRRESPGQGMVMLALVGNLLPRLSPDTLYFALFRAVSQVAADCDGTPPRRVIAPLRTDAHGIPELHAWFREASRHRLRDAAMRVLSTALVRGATDAELNRMLAGADADRIFSAQGHPFDAVNKGLELARLAGPERRREIVPLLVDGVIGSRGTEESGAWHEPIEVAGPVKAAGEEIPALLAQGSGRTWRDDGKLVPALLGDDPLASLASLKAALAAGAAPAELSKRVAYAAALRLARFAATNEAGDWFGPQHTFIYANAVHQAVVRGAGDPLVSRAIFHAAGAVYMDRFLNVPPAALPGDRGELDKLPSGADELLQGLLESLDQRGDPDAAGRFVARFLRRGHSVNALVDALTYATVREDLDFHTLQVLEAGAAQYDAWGGGAEGERVLVGVARQLAAFCPTRRAGLQTATIARRLHRGEKIYEEAGVS